MSSTRSATAAPLVTPDPIVAEAGHSTGAAPAIPAPDSLEHTMSAPLPSRTGLPVVAMVGAGQLARMTHQAAIALGQSLRVLATGPAESAALVAADVRFGDHRDLEALRGVAKGATVVTFDHE